MEMSGVANTEEWKCQPVECLALMWWMSEVVKHNLNHLILHYMISVTQSHDL